MAIIDVPVDQEAQKKAAEGGGPYEILPEGEFHLRVKKVDLQAAKSADKHPQLAIGFEVVATNAGQNVGKTTTIWVSLSPKAVPYFLTPILDAAGVKYEQVPVPMPGGEPEMRIRFDSDALLGTVLKAKNKHDSYTNAAGETKIREQWSGWELSDRDPMAAAAPPPAASTSSAAGGDEPPPQPMGDGSVPTRETRSA